MARKYFALLAIAALMSGCSQAATPAHGERSQPPADTSMLVLAKQGAQEKGSTLVAFAESIIKSVPYAVFVTYSVADEHNPATCSLQIVERVGRTIRVLEETDHLLFCSAVLDANVEQEQLSVRAENDQIWIYEERDKKNSTFEFVHNGNDWVVRRVSFNYPEQSMDSADVDVINEEGTFPGSMARTRVSDFDASSANLTRKVIR